ncbi:MAG: hypothetical protein LC114_17165, partial [Bryobacterales bacterium]|nr:hypothetical protein [Bryobacterales bacterium]
GVERLKNAIAKVGSTRYAGLCKELNLASDSIDDIPDRAILRRMIDVLEAESGHTGRGENTAPSGSACTSDAVAEARGLLLREASRVSTATRRSLGEVINHAANGAFQFSGLSSLGDSDLPAIRAALHNLQSTKQ